MKSKQKDQNGFWTHFILEAYCLYDAMKDKYERIATSENVEEFLKDLRRDEKNINWEVRKNPDYKPGRRKPRNCKNPGCPHPDKCLGKNHKMCPYFAWCSVEKEEYQAMMKSWEKVAKRIDRRIEREEKIKKDNA